MVSTIRRNPKKRLWMISITNIPIEKQNNANPMIRFIKPPKKHISLLIYAFLSLLFTYFLPDLQNPSAIPPSPLPPSP